MTATLVVDPHDPTPPYEQIRRQVADLIELGVMAAGDRLPPLRQLAGDLGVAVGTVGRAYAELEAAGLLVSHRGAGTKVAPRAPVRPRSHVLATLAETYVERARAAGCTDGDILAAVTERVRH